MAYGPLSETHPHIAAEATGWDPVTVTKGSNKKLLWRCSLGHEWEATVNNRTKSGSGCPVCSGRRVMPGINDLATTHPSLAAQALGWDPTLISASSHSSRRWHCAQGHEWVAVVGDRKKGSGCPICAGVKVLCGFNDLTTTHPELAAQAVGWDPTDVIRGSDARLRWRCGLGHEWEARVNHRAAGTGCPVCANKVVLSGFNDLAMTHPLLATEAAGWDPSTETAGSARRAYWRCEEGHEWEARINSRAVDGSGCPVCSGRTALLGVNDLATTHPELAAQAVGWDPTTLKAASNKRVRWRCKEGHEWEALIFSRAREGRGCPFCWGRLVTPGLNDLATLHPLLATEVISHDPAKLHAGTKDKVRWRCAEGHEWEAAVHTRTRKLASGCPACATYGFDPTKEGWLYLVQHDGWGLLQIGITNAPEQRVGLHERRGWRLLDTEGPMQGALVRNWERDILLSLADYGAIAAPETLAGRFDGYTESWVMASFPAQSIKDDLMGIARADTEQATDESAPGV